MQPAHSLVVFLPLCDLNEENGPTASLPGLHQRWTSDALEAEADAPGSSTAGAPAIMDVHAGDAIIFDYRILHRGLANTSAEDRPLAYFTYGRSWFRDATNYSSTSILPTPPSPPTASGPLDAESYEEDPIAALQKAMQKASDWVEHRNS